jgi:uncharacterized protein (DUF1697 family)
MDALPASDRLFVLAPRDGRSRGMTIYVSFIRGINVGGNKTIPMAKLKSAYESLRFTPVKTLLNSGNVVFDTTETNRAKLVKTIEMVLEEEFGFRPVVVLRTAAELKRIIAQNPFADMAKNDPSHLLVMTLAEKPRRGAKANLAKVYSGPEEIEIEGENVYVTYPNGIGKSKLTNAMLEKHIGVGTARNWNTLTKMLTLAEGV